MWMMPTGRPSSTTNSAEIYEELISSNAALAIQPTLARL